MTKSIPLWKDKEEFFQGMQEDDQALKMEEQGIPKQTYKTILQQLKTAS